MEFIKQIKDTDGLSRLILKLCEPLEDTVILALRADNKIKNRM